MLDAKPEHGRPKPIRISYSDCGRAGEPGDGLQKPVILYASGMMGGRYQGIAYDAQAREKGIRFIAVDRPGIGGSEAVPLEYRILTWVDLVPALLSHLDIKCVSLLSHSAGIMYMLSTILHLRHILNPQRPYAAFISPWVPPQHSGVVSMHILSALPAPVIASWDTLAKFHIGFTSPLVDVARTGLEKTKYLSKGMPVLRSGKEEGSLRDGSPVTANPKQGIDAAVQRLTTTCLFAENVSGASQEALLCMGKGQTRWAGLKPTIEQILISEEARQKIDNRPSSSSRLKIALVFAEKDEMIGTKGANYLISCLNCHAEGCLDIDDRIIAGSDHNSILSPEFETMRVIFDQVSGQH